MTWRDVYEAELEMRKTLHRQQAEAHDAAERAHCEFALSVLVVIAMVAGILLAAVWRYLP
jgi:hypothetical protein